MMGMNRFVMAGLALAAIGGLVTAGVAIYRRGAEDGEDGESNPRIGSAYDSSRKAKRQL